MTCSSFSPRGGVAEDRARTLREKRNDLFANLVCSVIGSIIYSLVLLFLFSDFGEKLGEPNNDLPAFLLNLFACIAPFQLIAWIFGLWNKAKERKAARNAAEADPTIVIRHEYYWYDETSGGGLFWLCLLCLCGSAIAFAPILITQLVDIMMTWLGDYLPFVGTKIALVRTDSLCIGTIVFLMVPPIYSFLRLLAYDRSIATSNTNSKKDELSRLCLILSGTDVSSFPADDLAVAQGLLDACEGDVNNLARWNVVGQSISAMRDDMPLCLTEDQQTLFEKSRRHLQTMSD